jgi:ribosomal protein L35AE/L33A
MTMKKILLCGIITATFASNAAELTKENKYRAKTAIDVSSDGTKFNLKVGSQSKFIILDNDDKDKYAIKFTNIYPYSVIKSTRTVTDYKTENASDVIENNVYYLSKKEVNGVPIESKVEQSYGGIVSGPLVVPFKYRLDDKSIGGDATVGYYAGYGFDVPISDQYITLTPFLSAGLTQVSVLSEAEDGTTTTDSKSGFSWATGFLIQNWDSVNIGIVYGQDRIGDKNWAHEGEGWVSISVGWKL